MRESEEEDKDLCEALKLCEDNIHSHGQKREPSTALLLKCFAHETGYT